MGNEGLSLYFRTVLVWKDMIWTVFLGRPP